jgi:hypothetical protein
VSGFGSNLGPIIGRFSVGNYSSRNQLNNEEEINDEVSKMVSHGDEGAHFINDDTPVSVLRAQIALKHSRWGTAGCTTVAGVTAAAVALTIFAAHKTIQRGDVDTATVEGRLNELVVPGHHAEADTPSGGAESDTSAADTALLLVRHVQASPISAPWDGVGANRLNFDAREPGALPFVLLAGSNAANCVFSQPLVPHDWPVTALQVATDFALQSEVATPAAGTLLAPLVAENVVDSGLLAVTGSNEYVPRHAHT